jgi:nitroimidazol reductase NimA-like FMN-containing flavoprotein (pyridoxamine 5'-phosphate oxidase superfamily)
VARACLKGAIVDEPITELDERFSDPGAEPTTWLQALQALESAELFWISTVRASGRPHVTPLVAVWLNGALHFCTGAGEQKALNLRGNPYVALTTGCDRWGSGLDVVVEGRARQVTDHAALTRLAEAWARKWDGRWRWEPRDGAFYDPEGDIVAQVYEVRPTKVLAFGKGAFSHTRHRF